MTARWAKQAALVVSLAAMLLAAWLLFAQLTDRVISGAADAAAAALFSLAICVAIRYKPYRRAEAATAAAPEDLGRRPFEDLAMLRERLRWGGRSPEQFDRIVLPVLVTLADDRLSRRHGLRRDSPTDRVETARLIGPDLLAILERTAPARVPSSPELDNWIARIEAL